MQLTPQITSLLAVLSVLQPDAVVALPVHPEQAILAIRDALAPNEFPGSSGLRVYRRLLAHRRHHSRRDSTRGSRRGLLDGSLSVDVPLDIVGSFQLQAGSDAKKAVVVDVPRHRRANVPRSFHALPFMRVTHEFVTRGFTPDGVPGVVDIVSPTVDDPAGQRLASLSVASNPSEANQFVLNASGVNATTVYLVVNNHMSLLDRSLVVRLEVPVYDQSRAAYTPYCATFDMTQASPLMIAGCDPKGITDHNSQLFSYATDTGVIKPLWLSSASTQEVPSNNTTTTDKEDPAAETMDASADGTITNSEPTPFPQNIALIFTPELDGTVPVVNAHMSSLPSPSSGATAAAEETPTETSSTESASPTPMENALPDDMASPSSGLTDPADLGQEALPSPTVSLIVVVGSTDDTDEAEPTSTEESNISSSSETVMSTPTESISPKKRQTDSEGDAEDFQDEGDSSEDGLPEDQDRGSSNTEGAEVGADMQSVDTGYSWRFTARGIDIHDLVR